MSLPPDLEFFQPTITGHVRIELYGNREDAPVHIHRARTQLGIMCSYTGVFSRMAVGEPGGFYHSVRDYEDGVRIQVITNDGQHTLRIWAPPVPVPTF